MKVSGEWVILGHGRSEADVYVGPGTYAEIEECCHSWNETQTAREQRGEALRGSLQRFYIKRAA
ncbi:hypothetical protein J7E99_11815 [Streptomyces sp. ISL-44]|uniref:hypothetical protein n=1 Tax=Streptomyces sp. ISL-44 TaxID=2819184 RepID=UPI001BE74D93|nr:hypothetical protein [Streptomyces sp. ISL-44]MBT2541377.1 hypothetical protein [Streptomyces sp. ISL-44]